MNFVRVTQWNSNHLLISFRKVFFSLLYFETDVSMLYVCECECVCAFILLCPCVLKWNIIEVRASLSVIYFHQNIIACLLHYRHTSIRYDSNQIPFVSFSNGFLYMYAYCIFAVVAAFISFLLKIIYTESLFSFSFCRLYFGCCCCCSFISIFLSIRQDFKMNVDYNKWIHSTNKIHCVYSISHFHCNNTWNWDEMYT